MESIFSRTELIIGKDGVERLKGKKVAIIGIGGVGSWAAEAIARAGVGSIVIVDSDTVAISNINRQIIALHSTLGLPKVEVMKKRLLDINPDIEISAFQKFFDESSSADLLNNGPDYVVDAIDSMKSKVHLIYRCKLMNIPIISSMGAGNKMDPGAFMITDLSKTSVCPLARIIRKELKKLGIVSGIKVVISKEPSRRLQDSICEGDNRMSKGIPGSMSFVPPSVGLLMAGEVIKDLLGRGN